MRGLILVCLLMTGCTSVQVLGQVENYKIVRISDPAGYHYISVPVAAK